MSIFRIVVVLAILSLMAAVAPAVTFGQPDNGGHPYVATLLFKNGGTWYSCSATLISPTVLVTAAHCTVEGDRLNSETWVNFSPVISFTDHAPGETTFEAYLPNHSQWIKAEAVVPHSGYKGAIRIHTTSAW